MPTRVEFERQIIEKAQSDESFRKKLIANPKQTLEAEPSIAFPSDVSINVLEETNDQFYLVLPPALSRELDDSELDNVSGGGYAEWWLDQP